MSTLSMLLADNWITTIIIGNGCNNNNYRNYITTVDVGLPDRIQGAMQMQVEAERKKRAAVLESEGHIYI